MLGLFMIVEMLLTHNPQDKEIGDSLSHQISSKMALLSPRFSAPLDHQCFGADATAEKVWKKLYEYRSKIAHGSSVEFAKSLRLLSTPEAATAFLESATRRLLHHALTEPALCDALKPI